MRKGILINYLQKQSPELLLELLDKSFTMMSQEQRYHVFWTLYNEIPPPQVDVRELLDEIAIFVENSHNGAYYEPFEINSQNFNNIPDETSDWLERAGDLLKDCYLLSKQGELEDAVHGFSMLYELIQEVESGEEIIFSHETVTYLLPGDLDEYLAAYIQSLSQIASTQQFIDAIVPLVRNDIRVYQIAKKNADKAQFKQLKSALRRLKIRITNR